MIKTAQLGHHGHAKTPDGAAIATRLAVIEAAQLLASHDAHGNKTPGYPAELQPRDRCRTTSINWIQKTAAALDPDSLGQTTRADTGAPIVGQDLIVESGNGRTIAIAHAYTTGQAEPYRAWLTQHAAGLGITAKIAAFVAPVLVRIRQTDLDRAAFARAANQDDKLAMTATEIARADAAKLTPALVQKIGQSGDLLASDNAQFLAGFCAAMGHAEAAQYLTNAGAPTASLIARAQSAIFARAYRHDRLLELTADSAKPECANLLAALNAAAPAFIQAEAHPLASQAIAAIIGGADTIKAAKIAGASLADHLAQQSLFDQTPPAHAAMAKFIAAHTRSPRRLGAAFTAMACRIRTEADRAHTADMFSAQPITLLDIIHAANAEIEKIHGIADAIQTADLFNAQPEPQKSAQPAAAPESPTQPQGPTHADRQNHHPATPANHPHGPGHHPGRSRENPRYRANPTAGRQRPHLARVGTGRKTHSAGRASHLPTPGSLLARQYRRPKIGGAHPTQPRTLGGAGAKIRGRLRRNGQNPQPVKIYKYTCANNKHAVYLIRDSNTPHQKSATKAAGAQRTAQEHTMQAQATDLAAQYPHLQQGQGAKIAAVNIRRMLKSAFPGVKFSVRTEYGSMMDAVNIKWEDGPTQATVDQMLSVFEEGRFDSMTDYYEYKPTEWTKTFGSAKYITANREHSDLLIACAIAEIKEKTHAINAPTPEEFRQGHTYNTSPYPIHDGRPYTSWQQLIWRALSDATLTTPAAPQAATAPAAQAAEVDAAGAQIIEHTTKHGKTLRGIVRADLDQAAAKAIDPYTFRKNGGWFIREKHLAGAQAAATKIDATEAQAPTCPAPQKSAPTATPAALQKMRDTAARTIADAQIELARERNTNTHRRARIATSIEARERAKSALGETMLALADAIQAGQAPALTKATTLAAVTLLEEAHRADRQTLPATEWGAATNPIALANALRQKSAYALANYIEMRGSITPETWRDLKTHLTEAQLQGHLGWWNVAQIKKINAWARLGVTTNTQLADALTQYRAARKNPRQADPIAAAERALIGQKIGVDFFPTPATLAQNMAELANIQPGQKVIEPSAGSGNLAQAAREAGAHVDCWEISSTLRDLLALKGLTLAGHDFTEAAPAPIYDAVLMNPPFSNRQDADHIQRAHAMLKPGGRLVAIAGEGVFNGQDAKAAQFRDWLTAQNAQVQKLPPGTFNAPGLLATTQANARMIIIHK